MKVRHGGYGSTSRKVLWMKALAVLFGFILLLAILYSVGQAIEKSGETASFGDLEARFTDENSITYQGKNYNLNPLIKSYLFIGVDNGITKEQTHSYRNGGQADFLMVLVIDTSTRTIRRIQIDRDTMAEITVLGVLGNNLGTNTHQICLSHGFGDGKEESCRFTAEAVSRLLCGIPIDGYLSLDLNGIVPMNELLGGVTVTLEDDFSALDPTMTAGTTLTLHGQQAEYFVRSRTEIGEGTNAERMQRQKVFLNSAVELIASKIRDSSKFMGTFLDGMEEYLITNLSRGKIVNEANKAGKYESLDTIFPEGEHIIGEDGFVEFHADEEALVKMVLDVFYLPQP